MSTDAIAQSVRDRLQAHARERAIPFDQVLVRYGHERLLYRIEKSSRRDAFLLKGATLFLDWTDDLHRPTRDADFLAYGAPDIERLEEMFGDILRTEADVEDGVSFDPGSINGDAIREDDIYDGVRLKMLATLGTARIHIRVDIGFGDAVTPGPEVVTIPSLLDDLPSPKLEGYPRETAVAEKYEAMVALGALNSRMKDFYDVWRLAQTFSFAGPRLSNAIARTFNRRDTALPDSKPVALTHDFAEQAGKSPQWSRFVRNLRPGFDDPGLESALDTLSEFLWPASRAASAGDTFDQYWEPEDGWHSQ